jgi:hypothetical protein
MKSTIFMNVTPFSSYKYHTTPCHVPDDYTLDEQFGYATYTRNYTKKMSCSCSSIKMSSPPVIRNKKKVFFTSFDFMSRSAYSAAVSLTVLLPDPHSG